MVDAIEKRKTWNQAKPSCPTCGGETYVNGTKKTYRYCYCKNEKCTHDKPIVQFKDDINDGAA